MEAPVTRTRLNPRKRTGSGGRWVVFYVGRLLQVAGLMLTLVAATAFFGTPDTIAMLRMMLVGVLVFVPGWLLTRRDPRGSG
jgi:hypothetical protein